jgi:oligoribonuclease NrnB/cAMP/cGMP phosphodiesterase (DHH superfamily)
LFHKVFPDAEYIPAKYNDEPPVIASFAGKKVFIVDFSYKRDVLLQIKEVAETLLVLDHHKTAEADLAGLDFCRFDMKKSGARMAWEYLCNTFRNEGLFTHDHPPALVLYTEDRDLWKWELPESRAFNAILRTFEFDFGVWDSLEGMQRYHFISAGQAILRDQAMTVKSKVEQSHLVSVEYPNHPTEQWRCANATTPVSETAGELAKETGIGCCWFEDCKGVRTYSLRSDANGLNVDVSAIAKRFNGGGHRNAAGFSFPASMSHPWIKVWP